MPLHHPDDVHIAKQSLEELLKNRAAIVSQLTHVNVVIQALRDAIERAETTGEPTT